MSINASSQLHLDFEPGLAERFDSLLDCVRHVVYTNKKPLKAIAADTDQSQSDMSRKLSGHKEDPRRLSVDDLEAIIEATGDTTPVLYLVEKFLADAETKQRAAAQQMMKMLPHIHALIKTLEDGQRR